MTQKRELRTAPFFIISPLKTKLEMLITICHQ